MPDIHAWRMLITRGSVSAPLQDACNSERRGIVSASRKQTAHNYRFVDVFPTHGVWLKLKERADHPRRSSILFSTAAG